MISYNENGFITLTQDQISVITQNIVKSFDKYPCQKNRSHYYGNGDESITENLKVGFLVDSKIPGDMCKELFALHNEIYEPECPDTTSLEFSATLNVTLDKVRFDTDDVRWHWTGSDYSIDIDDGAMVWGYFCKPVTYGKDIHRNMYNDVWLTRQSGEALAVAVKDAFAKTIVKENVVLLVDNIFGVMQEINQKVTKQPDLQPF